jgi:hypothetical protein
MKHQLLNRTFARLTVLAFVGYDKRGNSRWLCQCSCGTQKVVRGCNLLSGSTLSCGCLRKETWRKNGLKVRLATIRRNKASAVHGHHRRAFASPTYISWCRMKSRCTNSNDAAVYARYGGAGVTVCDRWLDSFEHFLADMGERPEGTTLSRFGDVGNYEPGNCAWHTWAQQRAEAKRKVLSAHAA